MTPDPTTTAARADAMTEEAPRDLANLVADALAIVDETTYRGWGGIPDHHVNRLARQVAELAQHVARLDADSIGDALARGVIEHADSIGRTYDDDPDGERSVAYDTGRNIGDALVTPPGAQILADWMAAPAPAAESAALDRIAAALNRPDPDGWDVGIMEEIAEILTETGREMIDVVDAWHRENEA